MSVELRLLSRVANRDQEISGPRLHGLLALLASDLRAGCSTAGLVNGLWPDQQPENPTKALQVLVHRVRSQLGAGAIASTPTGYRLSLAEDQVDAAAVLRCAAVTARHARAGDHAAALAHAEAGLALWESPPPDGAGRGDPVAALRAARAPTYRSLVRARALALSRLGRPAEAVGSLTELVERWPRDEEIMVELLRSEAATVGPAAALTRYEAYRRSLRDELGTDPGAALLAVHQQLLRGEAPEVRTGVPYEPNPLLGRDRDLAAVAELLRSSRVTSIVGPGGLGKTRLAYAVSRRERAVRLVSLARVTSNEDVAGEVASGLGVGEARPASLPHLGAPPDLLTGIVNALGPGPVLLVLDNCEQVISGAADLVRHLVSMTREVRVLTTSRSPLGLSSESVYLLPELDPSAAAELFAQRARAARPTVELPADAVERLCRHLDGLPLAVELAAARVRTGSVAEIAAGLADRFGLLRGGSRDAPQRHHTLHEVVDWSWRLLDPAGQAAMRLLSVFPDGFTVDAAGCVLGGDPDQVLPELVDQSLLKVADTPVGARFRMLETVREFSVTRREEAGETGRAIDRFLGWAREFGVAYYDGPFGAEPFSPVERIRAEQDNLMQALRFAIGRADAATVAATAAVLGALWNVESNLTRLRKLTGDTAWLLSHYRPEPGLVEVTRMTLTLSATTALLLEGRGAGRSLVALRGLPAAPPDTLGRAAAVVLLATVTGVPALLRLCDNEEPLVAGVANAIACYLREGEGDLDGALKAARRSLEAFERRESPWPRGLAHARVAELCLQAEQPAEAKRHLLVFLPMAEKMGTWSDVVGLRWWLALVDLQLGAVDEAEHWLAQAVPCRPAEDVGTVTFGLGVRAEIRLVRGDVEAGLELWRRAVDLLADVDDPLLGPWVLEAKAVTVVAHAHHRRLDLVAEIAGELPQLASAILTNPDPRPLVVKFPIAGALLLALAMVDLDRGVTGPAARMIALADRLRHLRMFQPTMSSARAKRIAMQADRAAYDDAVSWYAALAPDLLRAAALVMLAERT